MFKQNCFFKKRSPLSMTQFVDLYDNQHSHMASKSILQPAIPNAVRLQRSEISSEFLNKEILS